MADNSNKRVQDTPYKIKYPHCMVIIFRDGSECHIDSTPGNERFRYASKDGTYTEVSQGGKRVDFTVGAKVDHCKSGMTLTVDHNYDAKICGHNRLGVVGGEHVEVLGHSDKVIAGDKNEVIGKHTRVSILGSAYMGVQGDFMMNVKGNYTLQVQGSTTMATAETHTVVASLIDLNP